MSHYLDVLWHRTIKTQWAHVIIDAIVLIWMLFAMICVTFYCFLFIFFLYFRPHLLLILIFSARTLKQAHHNLLIPKCNKKLLISWLSIFDFYTALHMSNQKQSNFNECWVQHLTITAVGYFLRRFCIACVAFIIIKTSR